MFAQEPWPVIAPDGEAGNHRIETFVIGPEEEEYTRRRALFNRDRMEYVPQGTYKRLVRVDDRGGRTVVMSNTPMEMFTNRAFVSVAQGRVLINGLGLGMTLSKILEKRYDDGSPVVTHVTVVEISEDVIKLVGPSFDDDPRVKIVRADALEWRPPKGVKYDVAWHDIWDYMCDSPDMTKLMRSYGQRVRLWQDVWGRDWVRQ